MELIYRNKLVSDRLDLSEAAKTLPANKIISVELVKYKLPIINVNKLQKSKWKLVI